jgi:hypothetical protein
MNPECHKRSSTSESMHDFKGIVESYVEARIKTAQDSAEHHVRNHDLRNLGYVSANCFVARGV